MIDARSALKDLLTTLTYTDVEGEQQAVAVFYETDLDRVNKARWRTPCFIIRGQQTNPSPADVGWGNWVEETRVTVSLYLKQRATDYDSEFIRQELSEKVETLTIQNKAGIGGADYLLLKDVTDRDWVEKPGLLRRDFEFEVYNESWW